MVGVGIQGLPQYFVFPQVALNGAMTMWSVLSQDNRIPSLKLLKYLHFNNFNGGGGIYISAQPGKTC